MPSFETKPYVYKLTRRNTGEFYIGYREANIVPAHQDLGGPYRTSSGVIRSIGFDEFDYEILAEFDTGVEAYHQEQLLIKENFKDPKCLNRHYVNLENGKLLFRFAGNHSLRSRVKMSESHRGFVHTEETKNKMSVKMMGNAGNRGNSQTEEHKRKRADSRRGKGWSEELKQRQSEKIRSKPKLTCPHCGLTGGHSNMKRWHFDNCKEKHA